MPKSPINTKRVTGRRIVRYESFDEILADAERWASIQTRVIGNWSVGQIYCHLAKAAEVLIDGAPLSAPSPIQWLLKHFLKRRLLNRTLSPGFQLHTKAAALNPEPMTTEEGLQLLRNATTRIKQTDNRTPNHPAFGKCSPEDWNAFHLRHCELHMSFIVPKDQFDPKVGETT
jgi:hypothetical protein